MVMIMKIKEYIKKLNKDLKNLQLRCEELKLVDAPEFARLWCKKKLRSAVENLADASMIICQLYPDDDIANAEEWDDEDPEVEEDDQ